eukprot:TRINITY_DN28436_c0_g1_i1.p2 TRINITY_DN28436_c0_g1~~TRINITY_DN28436_c0_g1_i1.p2  ORF type:complete len:367 (+),score=96.62 TRINITY_DN28436_c0_g1_i1:92-1102(+)
MLRSLVGSEMCIRDRSVEEEEAREGEDRVTLLDDTYELAIIGVASLVELIAAGKLCTQSGDCSNQNGFAVAGGCGSMLVCIAFFSMNVVIPDSSLLVTARHWVGLFLTGWWLVAVVVLTFDKPFTTTGNGYFACWAAFVGSLMLAFASHRSSGLVHKMKTIAGPDAPRERRIAVALLLSSLVEFSEATISCIGKGSCGKLDGFAVAAGTFSLVATTVILILIQPSIGELGLQRQHALRGLVVLLGVWWLCSAGIMTYDAPFTQGGNGFFSTWASFILASVLAVEVNNQLPSVFDGLVPEGEMEHSVIRAQPISHALPIQDDQSADDTIEGTKYDNV